MPITRHPPHRSAAGLDWAAAAELDEAGLERRLLGRSTAETQVVEADFARVHIELRRKGVTLMLLWQEYRAAHEGRRTWAYTQFCEHYKAFAKTLKRSMRQHRRAGEKLFGLAPIWRSVTPRPPLPRTRLQWMARQDPMGRGDQRA